MTLFSIIQAATPNPNIKTNLHLTKNETIIAPQTPQIVVGESEAMRQEREAKAQQEAAEAQKRVVLARERQDKGGGDYIIIDLAKSNNCYDYVREQGKSLPSGYHYAKYLPVSKQTPSVGEAMVTYEGAMGHVVYIIAVDGEYLTLRESGYSAPYVTQRTIKWKNNSLVKGFL